MLGVLTKRSIGVNMPNEDTKDDTRMIWKVRLLREEKSKKGNSCSWVLFLSFNFLFWDFRCRIARRWKKKKTLYAKSKF